MSSIGSILKALNRWLGWFLVIAILLVALLTVVVRQLLPAVWDYREEIEQYLSERLRTEVSIGDINASWEGRFPTLLIQNVVIADHRSQNIGRVDVGQLVLGLNPVSSLLKWQPVLSKVELWSLHAKAELVSWPKPQNQETETNSAKQVQISATDPLGLLWLQPHIFFYDTQLDLTLPSGKQMLLQSDSINLENSAQQHHFSGELLIRHKQKTVAATLRVESDSYQFNPKTTNFNFYLKLAGIDTPLLEAAGELFPVPMALKELEMGAEVWGNWSEGRLTRVFGSLDTDKLALATDNDLLPLVEVQDLSTGFVLLQPVPREFQLQINEFSALINKQPLYASQVVVNRKQGQIASVALKELDLKSITEFIVPQHVMSDALKDVIKQVAPEGKVRNLELKWPEAEGVLAEVVKGKPQNWQHLSLEADLEQVGFSAAYGAPAMSGVDGLLQLEYGTSGLRGRVDVKSDNLGLHFPEIFNQGWKFTSASGVTHFSLAENILHLHSEHAELKKTGINAAGRWSLFLPLEREIQSELTLLIGVKGADGRLTPELIPDHEIDPGIKTWVSQAVKQGDVNQGGFMLHTGTRRIASRQPPTVQLFMDIADATVDYQTGWPAVTGADASLLLRDQGLTINVSDGKIYNSEIEHGWVYLPPGSHNLNLLADLAGDSGDIERTLLESPVIGDSKELAAWQLSGQADTHLKLLIPLDGAEPDIDVSSRFKNLKLVSKKRQLNFEKLSGLIGYSNDKGLYSEPLTGVFFGHPLSADINTSGHDKNEIIRTKFKSGIKIKQLREWSGLELLALAEGDQAFDAELDICVRSDCSGLTLRSNLKQTELNLIAPFNKTAGVEMPLLLRTDFETPQTFNLKLGGLLSGWFQLEDNQLTKGRLVLGGADARPTDFAGLLVAGKLDQLDYDQLINMLEVGSIVGGTANKGGAQESLPLQVDIDIDQLSYSKLKIKQAKLLLKHQTNAWDLNIAGQEVKVRASLPDDPSIAPTLLFDRLNLDAVLSVSIENSPQMAGAGEHAEVQVTGLAELPQPGLIPDFDIDIRDLILKGKRWGRWSFNLRTRNGQTYIENIAGQQSDLKTTGNLVWRPGKPSTSEPSTSELSLVIEAKNLGESLESAGYDNVLETEKFNANLQLNWEGAPWEYELAALDGAAKFNAREGRLIESGGAAGFLRVFGILNMNALGRRLKLDFADLFSKGVSFDRMEGDYLISKGVASTKTPFIMRGPSLDMAMSGDIDLIHETVDQQMAVTLPVTDNLPFAAVLLGAPQIAGLAFLLDKLVGDEVKKEFATVTYTMQGDWSDPKVELLQRNPKDKTSPEAIPK